jgi:hypothetical protein
LFGDVDVALGEQRRGAEQGHLAIVNAQFDPARPPNRVALLDG